MKRTQFLLTLTVISLLAATAALPSLPRVLGQQADSCAQPPANMLAWWQGEEDSNFIAEDFIGSHHGTEEGDWGHFSPAAVGEGFNFPGSTDFVSVPDSDDWNFGEGEFSIDFWANFNPLEDDHPFISQQDESVGWDFQYLNSTNELVFTIRDVANGDLRLAITLYSEPDGAEWYHIALTRYEEDQFDDAYVYTFYVNGIAVGIVGDPDNVPLPDPDAPLLIGHAQGQNFEGGMDEVEIFDRALSADEIDSIFDAGSLGKCTEAQPPTGTATSTPTSTATGTPALATSTPTSCAAPPQGMRAWFRGEGNVLDYWGDHDGGFIQGPITYTPGKVGQAFTFGPGQKVLSIPASQDWAINLTPMTFDFWVSFASYDPANTFGLLNMQPSGNVYWWRLTLFNNQLMWAFVNPSGQNSYFALSPQAFAPVPGRWYHIAFSWGGGGMGSSFFYIDGVRLIPIEGGGLAATPGISLPLLIGSQFEGQIDEVEVFNRNLSQAEILAIYNAGSNGKCTNVTPSPTPTATSTLTATPTPSRLCVIGRRFFC